MKRLFRLSILMVLLGIISFGTMLAQNQVFVSGRVAPGDVRIFVQDSVYIIDKDFVIEGSLIIEPGTTVYFYPNGRIINAMGGRIIADGNASTTYTQNPGGLNPIAPGSMYDGYSDPGYFLYSSGTAKTIGVTTTRDVTVNSSKYNYVFNVVFDTLNKKIVNLQDPTVTTPVGGVYKGNNNHIVVTFEHAILWEAARLKFAPTDVNLKMYPWTRINQKPINIANKEIKFIGSPTSNFSREWGHFIILPGSRASFFRNVSFNGFRKDTTVDRNDLYDANTYPWAAAVNAEMKQLTNGSGGAITTFSSRTWLLNVTFKQNMARYRGGALQLLQSPAGFPATNLSGLGYYAMDKNPNINNKDLSVSSIISKNPIPRIDNIDETVAEPLGDYDRQSADDGRLALYLGRIRNLKMDRNYVQISNVIKKDVGGILVTTDDIDNPANFPQKYGNGAFGGAIYMAGREENRQIEVGLGVNNSIKIGQSVVNFSTYDSFLANRNFAANYQDAGSSEGSRGGAIYIGEYTSLILAGEFTQNETYTKYMEDASDGKNSGYYSMGGAVFMANTEARLQLRGGPRRADYSNRTKFYDNRAGAGGAIYIDGNAFPEQSPIIGGVDLPLDSRNLGFDIKFLENKAITWGGAIFTNRNFWIMGSGGTQSGALIGYDGNYDVLFDANTAGYAGGAIHVSVPVNDVTPLSKRTVQMTRTRFENNKVGFNIKDDNRAEIRGGGAIYSLNAELNLVRGVEFKNNEVRNGNGAALSIVNPTNEVKRYFISDVDVPNFNPSTGLVDGYTSTNDLFTYRTNIPATVSMLTRFIDNKVSLDNDILESQSGSGATQYWQGTVEANETMYGTYWMDKDNGVAVGAFGKIIRYSNGGTTWMYPQSPTPYRLEAVTFTSSNVGYAVGDRGVILKTDNGGFSWRMINNIPTDKVLKDVSFVGTEYGWAVSETGEVLATTNSGEVWVKVQQLDNSLNGVYFKTNAIGYVVGEKGAVLKTTNGGSAWTVVDIPGLKTDLNKVMFTSSTTGYAVGDEGILVKTTNGGDGWNIINTGTTYNLNSIAFYASDFGYIVGQYGTALKSVNGGNTWTAVNTGTDYSLYDISSVTGSSIFAVGDVALLLNSADGGDSWKSMKPADGSYVDVRRYHQEVLFPENGVGLGGGIYILDRITETFKPRKDSLMFNRVRWEGNTAYTGSAIYSDNYDMKLILNRSLVINNTATSEVGKDQNYIIGAAFQNPDTKEINGNFASSDLAGATIYGEVQGPLPYYTFSEAANSIYGNNARFLIRLPDAPNTKGILAGTTGIGFGGTDTLRGNFWGHTEADVNLKHNNIKYQFYNEQTGETETYTGVINETFFIEKGDKSYLPYLFPTTTDPRNQGPFEHYGTQIVGTNEVIKEFIYTPVPALNGTDENTTAASSIPEKYLFSGRIYDIYDKGTDIKSADYSKRRLVPIEDFAVGIPPIVKTYTTTNLPSTGKYVKRWTRDPYYVEMKDAQNKLVYPNLAALQSEFYADKDGNTYHPIGYPLYLEAAVDYAGDDNTVNNDYHFLNQTVYFVINETTGDYIRVPLTQVSEVAPSNEVFRATVELVPDLSRRNQNPLVRRTAEGLQNWGTGPFLLENLYRNGYKEDGGALRGRKYIADNKEFATVPDLFSNRPGMPASNFLNGVSNTTFFGGEKYTALPVSVGDVVRVISRTILWRDGANTAYTNGISFKISGSTEPPIFTGNIPTMEKTLPVEFKDKIFISEDRSYPAEFGKEYSKLKDFDNRGRDSVASITAIDPNQFYDPRSFETNNWSAKYAQLTYDWSVSDNSGLYRWVRVDTLKATEGPWWQARGYLHVFGTPINPYVVPGGESIKVGAANYPPNYRTYDSLLKSGAPQDVLDRFIETYPGYYSSPVYDTPNARFLQQDTINFGRNYRTEKEFKVFVVDSVPRFLDPGETELGPVKVIKDLTTRETGDLNYTPSVYTCNTTSTGRLIANLTDKLRFQIDLNTDDEIEDKYAQDNHNWSFPYGRTAYGFATTSVRPMEGDTSVIDTIWYDGDQFGQDKEGQVIIQTKPAWMSYANMHMYGKDNDPDKFASDFTTYGRLNIRVPRAQVLSYLTPGAQTNGSMNTDTMFVIAVNDGHSGISYKRLDLFVNFQPQILTASLPDAIEGSEYNLQLMDSSKQIKFYDPNFGQKHRFQLIYTDDSRASLAIDDCYADAGTYDLAAVKTTPRWLMINKETGLLYGTPGVKDAPANITVTVVIEDENGLRHLKQIPMKVVPVNHNPKLAAVPAVKCVDFDSKYEDYIKVKDLDLFRNNSDETITIKLLDGRNNPITSDMLDFEPKVITGNGSADSVMIRIFTNNFKLNPETDGKITIKVIATDKAGKTDELVYRLQISLETDFICNINVKNARGSSQVLQFGTSSLSNSKDGVTTGDGTDSPNFLGVLDYQLCEFELPPLPPTDVFDARWTIPLRNGTLRNVYPVALPNIEREQIYKARFQAGGENGQSSPAYPVTISWKPKEVPTTTNTTANPTGAVWYLRDFSSQGNYFSFEMTDPSKNFVKKADIISGFNSLDAELFEVIVNNASVNSFVIVHDWANSVDNNDGIINGISMVSPNPVNNSQITYGVTKSSEVRLEVVDMLGNTISTLVNEYKTIGTYTANWNGIDQSGKALPAGTYTLRLVAGNGNTTYPVVIVR